MTTTCDVDASEDEEEEEEEKMMVVRKAVGVGHTRAATTTHAPYSSPVLYIRVTKRAERVSTRNFR